MKVKPLTKNGKAGERSGHENKFGFEHIEAEVIRGCIDTHV